MSSPKSSTGQTNAEISRKLDEISRKLDRLLKAGAAQPQAASGGQPTFCGYRCSWDIDDAGWPSYIHLEDGSMAALRTGKGSTDHWYSVKLADGEYGDHYLKFRRASPPDGLLVMPSATSAPPAAKAAKQTKQAKPAAAHRRNGQRPAAKKAAPPVKQAAAAQAGKAAAQAGKAAAQMRELEMLGRGGVWGEVVGEEAGDHRIFYGWRQAAFDQR